MSWIKLMDGDDLIKVRKAGNTGYWWVLKSTDLADACGEEEAAKISGNKRMLVEGELSLVPGKALCSAEQHKSVLETYGWDDAPDTEEAWIEMAHGYGLKVIVESSFGGTNESALRRTLKEASFLDFDGPVDYLLSKPVNLIGQTGLEHLNNNMDSCLKRAACHNGTSDEQRLMAYISSPQTRTVNQGNLTGECWLVQIWGIERCKTCEFHNTTECGGKNIRQTGKNKKNLEVPVK